MLDLLEPQDSSSTEGSAPTLAELGIPMSNEVNAYPTPQKQRSRASTATSPEGILSFSLHKQNTLGVHVN